MDELVAFVRARLDEAEAKARRVPPDQAPVELRAMVMRDDSEPFLVIDSTLVFRSVEADRRLLAELDACQGDTGWDDAIMFAVRCRATTWSTHPDYREDWKP